MPSTTLRLKNFVDKGESHHFARLELGPARLADLHQHDFVELFWIDKGRGLHVCGNSRVSIESGAVIFVRPEDRHTVGAIDPEGRIILCNLAFRMECWKRFQLRHFRTIPDWFCKNPSAPARNKLATGISDFLHRAGLELAAGQRSQIMLERFLLNLAFIFDQPEPSRSPPPAWLLVAAGQIDREKLFRNEGGAVLARISGRSGAHVAREVRRHFDRTPTDWINLMRMRHAGRLLSETSREILDICADCGLENLGHFYRLFRQYHGVTPREYRRRSSSIARLSV